MQNKKITFRGKRRGKSSSLLDVQCDRTDACPRQLCWKYKPKLPLIRVKHAFFWWTAYLSTDNGENILKLMQVDSLTWPRELNFFVEDSAWMCLFNKLPLRCEVAELSWALTALAAHFHPTQQSVVTVGWAGEGGAEHSHLAAASSSSSSSPTSARRGLCLWRGVQKCCFPLWWCWNTSREGPTVQCQGRTLSLSGILDVFL